MPKVKLHYVPVPCQHCDDAPCLEACPVEGAIYRREDGLVIIDPQKCTGCRECLLSCPYDALFFNEDLNIAQKCTGCAHLLDDGWTVPRCVDICPTGRIKFGDESEFAAEIAKADPARSGRRDQAARLLPQHAQALHRRPGLRPGREGDRRGRPLHAGRRGDRREASWSRPMASATSGSRI